MKKVLIFPASQRSGSLNRRLALSLAMQLDGLVEIDVLDPSSVDLPLFNQDIEREPAMLARVEPVYRRFLGADGFIVASPEYNGSVSPYLKNTVDWISRLQRIVPDAYLNPLQEKPVLLASAAAGASGGLLGLQAARQVFNYLGCLVLPEQVCVPRAASAWAADGGLADEALANWAEHALDRFLRVLEPVRWEAAAEERSWLEG